jgi:hypothetical protein
MRHEMRDEISLAIGCRVAERLRQDPELLDLARRNLDQWSDFNANVPTLLRCYDEWRGILKRPLSEVCDILCSDSEEARRLRQNSPFAGVLSPREVWELKQQFHATAAT